jgi:hypothetical protein
MVGMIAHDCIAIEKALAEAKDLISLIAWQA